MEQWLHQLRTEAPRNLRLHEDYNFTGAWVMDPALWEETRSRATTPDPLLPTALIAPPPEFIEGSSRRPLEEEVGGGSYQDARSEVGMDVDDESDHGMELDDSSSWGCPTCCE